jgi:hypothetical protein
VARLAVGRRTTASARVLQSRLRAGTMAAFGFKRVAVALLLAASAAAVAHLDPHGLVDLDVDIHNASAVQRVVDEWSDVFHPPPRQIALERSKDDSFKRWQRANAVKAELQPRQQGCPSGTQLCTGPTSYCCDAVGVICCVPDALLGDPSHQV